MNKIKTLLSEFWGNVRAGWASDAMAFVLICIGMVAMIIIAIVADGGTK